MSKAIEAVRSLIDRIAVTPTAGKLTIDLYGEIAAILCMAAGKKAADVPVSVAEQLVMVAGARLSYCSHGRGSGFRMLAKLSAYRGGAPYRIEVRTPM
jgi:hypothetical protein